MSNPDELLDVNCSRCGKPLRVRIAELGNARLVECEECASRPPHNARQVYVVFEQASDSNTASVPVDAETRLEKLLKRKPME